MKYVVETLIEAPEGDEDPVELTEEDVGYLFLLLKTVVDLLDKAAWLVAKRARLPEKYEVWIDARKYLNVAMAQ